MPLDAPTVVLCPTIQPGQQASKVGQAVSYPVRAVRVHLPGQVVLPEDLRAELDREDRTTRARRTAAFVEMLLLDAMEAAPELRLRAGVMIDPRPGAGR